MQEYVQKSTRTTLPRSWLRESDWLPGVLNHVVIPGENGRLTQRREVRLVGHERRRLLW